MEDFSIIQKEIDQLNIEFGDNNFLNDLKEKNQIEEVIKESDSIINEAKKILSLIIVDKSKLKRKKYTLKQKAAILSLLENNMSRHEIERDYDITDFNLFVRDQCKGNVIFI